MRVLSQSFILPTDYFFLTKFSALTELDALSTKVENKLYPLFIDTNKIMLTEFKMVSKKSRLLNCLFSTSLISVSKKDTSDGRVTDFSFAINPVLNVQAGLDLKDTSREKLYMNTRGFWLSGRIGTKVFFESSFFENQAVFPTYIDEQAKATGVIGGQGRWKKFKENGHDFAMSSGMLRIDIHKNFELKFGHGKQKIGTAYRSLLLSDNSFNYPQAQFVFKFWKNKLVYAQTYAMLMNLSDGGVTKPVGTERIFQKKPAAFQYLTFNPVRQITIGLFQSLVWAPANIRNEIQVDLNYFNPFPFLNKAVLGQDKDKFIMNGILLDVNPLPFLHLIGQGVYSGKESVNQADKRDKYAYLVGFRYSPLFGKNKQHHLHLSAEYIKLNGNVFSGDGLLSQNYTHYAQGLSFPFSLNNCSELVACGRYAYKRFFIQGKINLFEVNDNLNFYSRNMLEGTLGFLINPAYNLVVFASLQLRDEQDNIYFNSTQKGYQLVSTGIRTALYNFYWDN